jgi:hypothetical protein
MKNLAQHIAVIGNPHLAQIPVVVDNDPQLGYETHGRIRQLVDIAHLPLLNFLAPLYGRFTAAISPKAREIVMGPGIHRALELIYTYNGFRPRSSSPIHLLQAVGDYHWQCTATAKSGRNRRRLVKKIVTEILQESKVGRPHIIVLGSGSARPEIELLAEGNRNVFLTLVDHKEEPIAYSRDLAGKYGVKDRIAFVVDKAKYVKKYVCSETVIIESVGLTDYFDSVRSAELAAHVFEALPAGGFYVTSNVRHNPEETFVTKGRHWEMDYKYEGDLAHILMAGGFNPEHVRLIYEPCKIFGIAVARKMF